MAAFGAALDALQHVGRGGQGPAKKGAGLFTPGPSGVGPGPTHSLLPPGGTGKIVNTAQEALNRSAVSSRAGAGRNGGRFDFDDGGTYCGGWEMGKAEGYGLCTGPKGKGEFSGLWRSGFESSGVYTWPNGYTYEGDWQGGKRHGLGLETRARWIYAGEWTAGLKGRYGVRVNIPSSQQFQDGPQNAGGTTNTTTPYGLGGQGDASMKTVMAASAFESAAAAAKYEGTWANGLQDGYGTETYADGSTFQGQFLRGVRHGYGVRKSVPYGLASAQRTMLPLTNPGPATDEDDRSGMVPFWERDQRLEVRGGFVLKADCWSEGSAAAPSESVKTGNKLADMLGAVGRRKGGAASVITGPPSVARGCSLDRSGGRSVTLAGGDKGARRSSKLAQTLRKALSTSSQTKLGGGARGPEGGTSSPDVVFTDSSPHNAATSTATAFKFKTAASAGHGGTNPRKLISSESVESSYSAGSAPLSCNSGLDKNSRLYHLDSNLSFVSQDDIVDPGITETYSGEWKNDKRSGFGICERSDGLKYEGEWLDNKKHGYGVTCLPDGSRYAGKYKINLLVSSYPLSATNVKTFFRSFSPHHSTSSNSLHNITNTSITPSGKTRTNRHKSPNPFFFLANRNASKLKEKVDSAVSHALRAAGLSVQKAEIAAVRRLTAQEKAQQAEIAAVKARNNSDLARLNAKKYAPDFRQPGTEFLKKRLKERSNIFGAGAKMSLPEPVKEQIYGASGKPVVNKAVQTKEAEGDTFQNGESNEKGGLLHHKPSKKGGSIIKGLIKRSRSLYSRKGGTQAHPGDATSVLPTPNGNLVREGEAHSYLRDEEQTEEVSGAQRPRTGSEEISFTYSPSSYHPQLKVSPPRLNILTSGQQTLPRPKETSLKGAKARAGLLEGGARRHVRCIRPDPGNAQFFDHYAQYVEEEALNEVPKPSCTLSLDRDREMRGRSRETRRRDVRSDTLPTIVVPLQNVSNKLASAILKGNLSDENPPLLEEEGTEDPIIFTNIKSKPIGSGDMHKKFETDAGSTLHRRPSIAERGSFRYRVSPTHREKTSIKQQDLHSPPITLPVIAEASSPAAKVLMIRPPIVVSGRSDDSRIHSPTSDYTHTFCLKSERKISPSKEVAKSVGIKKNLVGRSKSPIPRRGSLPDVSSLDTDHVPGEWSRENISKLSSQRRREINRMKEELQRGDGHNVIGYYIKRLLSRLMFTNQHASLRKIYNSNIQTSLEGLDEMRSQLTTSHHEHSSFQDPLYTKRSKIMGWIWLHKEILLLFLFNVSLIAIFYHLLTT